MWTGKSEEKQQFTKIIISPKVIHLIYIPNWSVKKSTGNI
jgi:hypothetical protein